MNIKQQALNALTENPEAIVFLCTKKCARCGGFIRYTRSGQQCQPCQKIRLDSMSEEQKAARKEKAAHWQRSNNEYLSQYRKARKELLADKARSLEPGDLFIEARSGLPGKITRKIKGYHLGVSWLTRAKPVKNQNLHCNVKIYKIDKAYYEQHKNDFGRKSIEI